MANFSSESLVRLRFQFNDTVAVPADLVEACLDDAHCEVLRFLDPVYNTSIPEEAVLLGETLLAGAYVFRALASRDVQEQKHVTVGGHRIEEGKRFASLTAIATVTAEQAWYLLEPYVVDRPSECLADATASTPVLGEE